MVLPKRALIRLVRQPEGVQVDPTGKLAGGVHTCIMSAFAGKRV